MPLPPVPRDETGVPYPVVWDEETQNWKRYTGVLELVGIVEEGETL